MLNLLIAIMSDKYEQLQKSGHQQYFFAKASIILEYEKRMKREYGAFVKFGFGEDGWLVRCGCSKKGWAKDKRKFEALFPEWLQLLQAKTDGIVCKDSMSVSERKLEDKLTVVEKKLEKLDGLEKMLRALIKQNDTEGKQGDASL